MFLDLKIENVVESVSEWSDFDVASYKAKKDNIAIRLEEYLLNGNNLLDAEKIQQSVFPETEIDVFISHSHNDEDQAIRIALSLEEIGLKPFVDSCVWGYADELLKKIDNKFCIPPGWENYSYALRNRTTTNVHLILNAALQQMIHRSELFVFLGTESSIKIDEYMSDTERLSSPWIFSELMFAQNVKRTERKHLDKYGMGMEDYRILEKAAFDSKHVEFRYLLPQSTYSLDYEQFMKWLSSYSLSDGSDSITRISGLQHVDKLYAELGVDAKLLEAPRFS
ncbi:toll/interleukin-1 receptor domain-containing protein [Serratia sp. JSRIV004]|uniref:toll/interleukin-1 receptor domain-containing protein n=1 Tax=Serratia sp. JSRIV004 TaxID=2831895 RepID=UPI001CBB0F8E|nr:toll/interleukin-1 receptor domain-containing protein [Serratia sp. JSRIV004]UAN56216.1 toll/interleukin-1 receptor domain-containing protein [Serratia sp. JSRIV004]